MNASQGKAYEWKGVTVRVERDSVTHHRGKPRKGQLPTFATPFRLTTFVVRFWRCILAEINTHRMFSRSSASSRAIPIEKAIKQVQRDPYVPYSWRVNGKGMQPKGYVGDREADMASGAWKAASTSMANRAAELDGIGIHKEQANRLLEPFRWHEAIISSTDWDNFFALRTHPDAQEEFRDLARMMYLAWLDSKPIELHAGQWHLPFVPIEEQMAFTCKESHLQKSSIKDVPVLLKTSAARCAWVSYESHDGDGSLEKVERTWQTLVGGIPRHSAPSEHVATPRSGRHGNFAGWKQLRQFLPNENIINFTPDASEVQAWREKYGIGG